MRVIRCLLASIIANCAAAGVCAQLSPTPRDVPIGGAPRVVSAWTLDRSALGLRSSVAAQAALNLHVVIVDEAGWTRERAEATVREAAGILSQCGVRLAMVRFQLLQVDQRFRYLYTPASRLLAGQLVAQFAPRGPGVFFVRDTLNRPAFDAEAFGRGNTRSRPELADTVWVTAATKHAGIALAHELVHVLADSPAHSSALDNLMGIETTAGATHLTREQCAAMLDTALANGLLERE
jgi:hypothetical protein